MYDLCIRMRGIILSDEQANILVEKFIEKYNIDTKCSRDENCHSCT